METLTTEQKLLMVKLELDQAKRKHPHFVDAVTYFNHYSTHFLLKAMRDTLKEITRRGKTDVESVLDCELYEALDAYAKGDYQHAMQEFAQCAVVCVRAMEECEKADQKKVR